MALRDISSSDLISYLAVAAYSQQMRLPRETEPWQLLFFELTGQQGEKPAFLEDMVFDAEEHPTCRELNTTLSLWMFRSLNRDGTLNIDDAARLKPEYDTLDSETKAYVDRAVVLAKAQFKDYVAEWPEAIEIRFKSAE